MVDSLILIQGQQEQHVKEESLRDLSLANAKHLVIGGAPGNRVILHVAANSLEDLNNALREFVQVPGVADILTLTLRSG